MVYSIEQKPITFGCESHYLKRFGCQTSMFIDETEKQYISITSKQIIV